MNWRKDLSFRILMVIYILFLIADVVTTFMVGTPKEVLELNPVYQLTGSFIPIFVIQALTIVLLFWLYKKNVHYRFLTINTMVLTIISRIVAVKSAMNYINTPGLAEQVATTVTPAIKQAALIQMSILIYLPLIISLLVYFIWQFDHKIEIKN